MCADGGPVANGGPVDDDVTVANDGTVADGEPVAAEALVVAFGVVLEVQEVVVALVPAPARDIAQGDHSGCDKPPVDIKTKVPF